MFRSGDIEDLRRCMLLTRDDAVVRSAGQAAYRRHWAEPSEPRRHAAELLAIYDAVIERNGQV